MWEHHKRAITKLTNILIGDPRFLGLIIGGSLVKGFGREDSDIDAILVASDEEFEKRKASGDYGYWPGDICDYPGGYTDIKVVDMQFLRDVADHGSEPARSAFTGAFAAFSHRPEIESLIKEIPVYQESERQDKIERFYAQVEAYRWYVGEAEKRNNLYLLNQSVSQLILFGGRMILAYNRILYPYHKWFLTVLEKAQDKPQNLMELINKLLERPCKENADLFADCVLNFTDWGTSSNNWPSKFIYDSEWNWRDGKPPVQDC